MGVDLISKKEHLTDEGLCKIVSIRIVMNRSLTDVLKKHFTDLILVKKLVVELRNIDNLEWITGFVDEEVSFRIFIVKAPVSTGYSVMLRFTITQHVKDHKLVESLVNYFGCGWVFVDTSKPIVYFIVSNFSDIKKK